MNHHGFHNVDPRRPPTHVVNLSVPINVPAGREFDPPFNVVQDALRILLAVSRLAVAGAICGDPEAVLEEIGGT